MLLINTIKDFKNKFQKQNIELQDGSIITVKVRPKLGNKTKASIEWEKSIGNVDLNLLVQGQPIKCVQDGIGININQKESFKIEASATYKF